MTGPGLETGINTDFPAMLVNAGGFNVNVVMIWHLLRPYFLLQIIKKNPHICKFVIL